MKGKIAIGLCALLGVGCKPLRIIEDTPSDSGALTSDRAAVLTNRNDNLRTGANTRETVLTVDNVEAASFGLLFSRAIDGNAYAQPLYVPDLMMGETRHNVVLVATSTNHLYAFDADDPAAEQPLWSRWLAPLGEIQIGGRNPNTMLGQTWCRDMYPFVGITGTPVIDPSSGIIYLVTKQGRVNELYTNKLHAIDVRTGQDVPGSPVVLDAAVPGGGAGNQSGQVPLDAWKHLNRAGLLLAQGNLYIAMASHCDDNPYHGWLLAYDPTTLAQKAVFNTSPNGMAGGIRQSGTGPAASENGIYFSVGNGSWGADGSALGTSVVRLLPDVTVADWFTPFNVEQLNRSDADLAATMLVPGGYLVLSAGEEGIVYVIDQVTMTRHNPAGDQILQRLRAGDASAASAHVHTMAFWNDRLYLWPENHGLRVHALASPTQIAETPVARHDGLKPAHPGVIFSISANGNRPGTGILWATLPTAGDAWHNIATGVLVAIDAMTGVKLWDSNADPADAVGNFAKWSPPTIANGKVYVTSFARSNASSPAFLRVYGLKNP